MSLTLKQNKRSKRNPRKGRKAVAMKIERMEHPPQINSYQVTHSTTLRFTVKNPAVNTAISFTNLLDAMLVATTAIFGFQLFDVVKVKRVEAWGQAALGTPSTVEVSFTTATGDSLVHTDTSLGVRPAYVSARPSPRSLASFFSITGAGTVFILTAPAGSIVDVHLVYRTSNQAPVGLTNALVGAAPGEFYWRGLDGLAAAGTNFPPPAGVQTQ